MFGRDFIIKTKGGNKMIATNGYIGIIALENDMILTTMNNRWSSIRYDREGEPYFIKYGIKYYISEFVRV